MELPLGGPALRHYTQSRPRPHRQKLNYRPTRPQETIIESENEVLELMGRVDEGVEEFFTKRVLPTDILTKQDEETITVHEVAPASSVPFPPPTKTLRRKLGDFFTLKKRRGLKSETSNEGRPKKASIVDLIRPLREVARAEKEKDKDQVKEQDKENEMEKEKDHPSANTVESSVQETHASGAPQLRGEAVPPRRALREGKSQSLILLSGSAATGTTNARNTAKKPFEGQHSFEQKLHLMLQRIGLSKPQQGETQNQDGEMKKAESEGTIIDSKPEPPASFSKPRTMSASSDTRHQIRPSVSAHESAGKPALLPKPVIKPGPPPTTSGRNTPENELAQIQEGKTGSTPTKLNPSAVTSPPASPALTPNTNPTLPTISNSIPDSTGFTISPPSTVTPSDTDIGTDSVNTTAAATTPTNVTEVDSKASEDSAATAQLHTGTIPTPTSTTAPSEPPATVSASLTSSESITPNLSVTSSSTTSTTSPITTMDTVSAPSNESSVSTSSPQQSAKSSLPEPNGVLSAYDSPASAGDAAFCVTTNISPPSTSISDVPSGLTTTTNSVTKASEDTISATSASCVTLISPITKTTSPPPESSDPITGTVSADGPMITSSHLISAAPPPITSTPTRSPTATDSLKSISASTIPPASVPLDISGPATSSVETTPTGTTSTTISLNHADNTSTTNSATTVAVSSTLSADPDPAFTNDLITNLTTPTLSGSIHSQYITSPARSTDSPRQDNVLETSPEKYSSAEPAEKCVAAEEYIEMVQESKPTEMDDNKEVANVGKKNEKTIHVDSTGTRKEVQEKSDLKKKVEEESMAEPPSGKGGEGCGDEGVAENHKQEETKGESEK